MLGVPNAALWQKCLSSTSAAAATDASWDSEAVVLTTPDDCHAN